MTIKNFLLSGEISGGKLINYLLELFIAKVITLVRVLYS